MTTKIMYNPTPDPDWAFIEKWLKTPYGEMVVEPAYQEYPKLRSFDAPKKQKKPKHKVPFWAQDWRKK